LRPQSHRVLKAMTMRQYVRRFGLPPASQSNFESLAIDAGAFPRQRWWNEQKLTRDRQTCMSHTDTQAEPPLASMVLFDALALNAASCPLGRERATRQAAKLHGRSDGSKDLSNRRGRLSTASTRPLHSSDLASSASTDADSIHDPDTEADLQ